MQVEPDSIGSQTKEEIAKSNLDTTQNACKVEPDSIGSQTKEEIAKSNLDTAQNACKGISFALVTLFSWTVAPLLLSDLTSTMDVHTSNGSRFLMCLIALIPFMVIKARSGVVNFYVLKNAIPSTLALVVAQICFIESFYYISAAAATFALRSQMVAASILAALFFRDERNVVSHWQFILGATLLIAGSFGMSAFSEDGFGNSNSIFGLVLAFGGGVGYGAYGVFTKFFLTKKSSHNLHPVSGPIAFAVVCLEAGIIFVAIVFIFGIHDSIDQLSTLDFVDWIKLALTVLTGLWSGHTAYFMSFSYIPVSISTGIVQLQPLTVGIGAILFYGESFTVLQVVAGAVAIVGALTIVIFKAMKDLKAQKLKKLEEKKKLASIENDLEIGTRKKSLVEKEIQLPTLPPSA
eukprot:g3235.t1